MKKHIFIIRHGQTSLNINGKILGISNPSLTEAGIRQTYNLAYQLKQKKICPQVIYTSPLKRCTQTARIIQKNIGGIIKKSKFLREVDYGDYEGMSNTILRKIQFGYDSSMMLKGKGETVGLVEKRAKSFLKKLVRSKEENILIITHAFIASVLIQLIMNILRTFQTVKPLGTAGYKYFEVEEGGENINED